MLDFYIFYKMWINGDLFLENGIVGMIVVEILFYWLYYIKIYDFE